MSKPVIHENISLEQQPTIVKFSVTPSLTYINENHLQATGNYETYSYTGTKEQIDAKHNEIYNAHVSSKSEKCSLTRTRLNGQVWKLDVRLEDLVVQ
mgnify:CR=1 FL=1